MRIYECYKNFGYKIFNVKPIGVLPLRFKKRALKLLWQHIHRMAPSKACPKNRGALRGIHPIFSPGFVIFFRKVENLGSFTAGSISRNFDKLLVSHQHTFLAFEVGRFQEHAASNHLMCSCADCWFADEDLGHVTRSF
jgi:hypothetical protein